MLDKFFQSILSSTTAPTVTAGTFFVCTLVSLLLGACIAGGYLFRNRQRSKGFAIAVAMLPTVVQMVIMLVNGNLGAGVAVMGAFGLVRFRSAPGSAKEIVVIFAAMAVGLATGMGYLGAAAVFTAIVLLAYGLYTLLPFGEINQSDRELKITVPEGVDYTNVFTDLFETYTVRCERIGVKTANMGSLFKLTYRIRLKDENQEKALIDALRCRNGNLDIVCTRPAPEREAI